MDGLFTLSKYVLLAFLKDWLELQNICLLDVAICNRKNRDRFLALISLKVAGFTGKEVQFCSTEYCKWLQFRNVVIRDINIVNGIIPNNLSKVTNIAQSLHSLNICGLKKVYEPFLCDILKYCVELTNISLSNSEFISDAVLYVITTNNYKLKKLHLHHLSGITNRSVHLLAHYRIQLEVLTITSCYNVNSDAIRELIKVNKQSLLHFESNYNISDDVLTAISSCLHLTHFDISNNGTTITATGMGLVIASCPQLKYINLSNTAHGTCTDTTLTLIAKHLPLLQYIYLRACTSITDEGVMDLCTGCIHLCELDIRDSVLLSAELLRIVLNTNYSLQSISFLYECDNMNDNHASLALLAEKYLDIYVLDFSTCCIRGNPKPMPQSGKLMSETVFKTKFETYNLHTTPNDTMLRYLTKFNHLHTFVMNKCITDMTLDVLVPKLSNLTSLDLHEVKKTFTDKQLILFSQHCFMLTTLYMRGCGLVTNNGLSALLQTNCDLTCLNCDGCGLLNDKAVTTLADHCFKLQSLNINNCGRITESSVLYLLTKCRRLTTLYVWLFTLVAKKHICDVAYRHCKHLSEIWFDNVEVDVTSMHKRVLSVDETRQQLYTNHSFDERRRTQGGIWRRIFTLIRYMRMRRNVQSEGEEEE